MTGKNGRKEFTLNILPHSGAMMMARWQMCMQICTMLYRSHKSNDEIEKIWKEHNEKYLAGE